MSYTLRVAKTCTTCDHIREEIDPDTGEGYVDGDGRWDPQWYCPLSKKRIPNFSVYCDCHKFALPHSEGQPYCE